VWKRTRRRDMADVNVYTAGRLSEMARSLGLLARSCTDSLEEENGLTREDALAAMQMAGALVCGGCSRCNLYRDSEKEDSYYIYYLLRAFEQKGRVEDEDMPRLFLETCRQKDDYMMHLNRNLGRATMNLEWKNRFLESRDTVMVQFRELALILDEFAHQMEQATDITERRAAAVTRTFRLHRAVVENMLVLEYENRRREAYLTVRMLGGKCMTARDAAELFGQAMGSGTWYAPADTRNLITRQLGTIRFVETGQYRMVCGAARLPREGERVSGDNYTFINLPGQAVLSLSDGLGSGETACRESGRVVELTQQLLEAGFSARSALKMVNTILLLTGAQQHPATMDLCCVDLHTGVLEAMKMGAVAAFLLHEGSADILEAGQVPVGVIGQAEPLLLSKKLWDGDRIVMMTDGVLDSWPGEDKEKAVKEYLEGMILKGPQEMAEEMLQFACQWGDGPKDDMTILTAGIWKR